MRPSIWTWISPNAVQLRPEPFPIAELLQDIAQKYELAAKQNHIELQTRFAAEPLYINADIGLIGRVLENLLSNAVRHTPARGLIVLETTPQAHDAENLNDARCQARQRIGREIEPIRRTNE